MSDSAADRVTFAFLASCVGYFAQCPQCSIAALHGNNEGGRLFGVLFKATARNPKDRGVFKIMVTKEETWRVRVFQIANHVLRDERAADRAAIVDAVNHFVSLTGMVEGEEERWLTGS